MMGDLSFDPCSVAMHFCNASAFGPFSTATKWFNVSAYGPFMTASIFSIRVGGKGNGFCDGPKFGRILNVSMVSCVVLGTRFVVRIDVRFAEISEFPAGVSALLWLKKASSNNSFTSSTLKGSSSSWMLQ